MNKGFLALALVLAIGVSGCMGNGTADMMARRTAAQAEKKARTDNLVKKIEAAEIAPLPKDWKKRVEAVAKASLKDPDSAKFLFVETINPPLTLAPGIQKWGREEANGTTIFGWQIYFGINAKNSYGGYTGSQPWIAIFVDGKLLDVRAFGR